MIIWGGIDSDTNTVLGSGGRYNPDTDTWVPTSDSPIGVRWNHSAIWTGFEMVVWGGFASGNTTNRQGVRYDPKKDTWTLMSISNAPSGISTHKAVWTGTEMVIWEGHTSSYISALGIYYPPLEPLPELIFGGRGGSYEEPDDS